VELVNTAELRRGDFGDFNYETDAYPSSPMDPNMRLARFMDFLDRLPPIFMNLPPSAIVETMKLASKAMEEPGIDKINPDPEFALQKAQMAASQPQPMPPMARQPGQPQPGRVVQGQPSRIRQARSDSSAGALPAPRAA
jgi:hypothetical protein